MRSRNVAGLNRATATIRRARAAIDIASIMVGVLVISILVGSLSASVFGIIPWAQNEAAKAYLSEVVTAERVAKLPNPSVTTTGRYLDHDGLEGADLIEAKDGTAVTTDATGTCYTAVAKADSGRVFWASNRTPKPQLYLGDNDGCVNLSAMVASIGGATGLTSVTNLLTNPSAEAVIPGTSALRVNLAQSPAVQTTTGWSSYATGGTVTGGRGDALEPATSSYRGTVTTAGSATSVTVAVTAPGVFTPGASYTASIYGTVSWTAVTSASVNWFDGSGTLIRTDTTGSASQSANAVVRRSAATTVPSGAASAAVQFTTDPATPPKVGDTVSASAALFERTTALRPWFDGDSTDVNGWDYAWSGATSVALAAPVVSRQNLASYGNGLAYMPSVVGAGFRNTRYIGSSAYSVVTDAADASSLSVRSYVRKTWTASTTGSGHGFAATQANPETATPGTDAGLPITAGQTYTISAYVKADTAGKASMIRVRFFNPATGWVGSVISGTELTMSSANTWARPRLTVTAPAGATMAALIVDTGGASSVWQVGDTFDATQLLIEEGSTLQVYFDGTIGSGGGSVQEWTGLPNQSPSRALSAQPAQFSSSLSGQDLVAPVAGTAWKSDGNQSVRITGLRDGSATSVTIAGSTATLTGQGVTLTPGKTYTVIGTAQMAAVQKGTVDPRARSIVFADSVTGDAGIASNQLPNVIGNGELRLTFTVDPSASWANVRLFGGASIGNGDVSWDNLTLVEGVYDGPAFNGSTATTDTGGYQWAGLPNGSPSVKYWYR